jgi:hypothetical protein
VGDREGSIQVLMYPHRAARQGRSPAHHFDLQAEVLEAHGVVSIYRTLELQAENEVQVLPHVQIEVPVAVESQHT